MPFRMDDYVPVNERIEQFYTAYPNGSIQSEIVELTESRVTIKASVYRTPDDPRPGTGHSSLEIPGATSFTKGSEIENAETSAWGRAIAALGFEVKRGIASREEVSNKSGQGVEAERRPQAGAPAPADPRREKLQRIAAVAESKGLDNDGLQTYAGLVGIKVGTRATDAQLDSLMAAVSGHGSDEPLEIEPTAATPAVAAEPVAGAVTPAPAEPPQRDSEEYKALDARGKAQARSYWASKELEERQAAPLNPEPEPMELAL